jgi:hypothetical protein
MSGVVIDVGVRRSALLWVGSDDKIIIGHGAVATRFADGLPMVTEHQ